MIQPAIIAAVAAGGAIGSVARYGLARALQSHAATTFPWGTLAANLLGCWAIGFCYIWFENRGSPVMRDFVRVGFLGGLTTFSTYCIESLTMMEKGQYGWAAANVAGSVVGGLLAAFAGIVVAKMVFTP